MATYTIHPDNKGGLGEGRERASKRGEKARRREGAFHLRRGIGVLRRAQKKSGKAQARGDVMLLRGGAPDSVGHIRAGGVR